MGLEPVRFMLQKSELNVWVIYQLNVQSRTPSPQVSLTAAGRPEQLWDFTAAKRKNQCNFRFFRASKLNQFRLLRARSSYENDT